jgi:hypothetical protein
MCHCQNSLWLQRAREFIQRNQQDESWFTVNFLVQNDHCGIDRRVNIESILDYLRENGINLNREDFQQTILGRLKREGIVATLVYPGPQGGVFIPCNEEDIGRAVDQGLNRIRSEIQNLIGISQNTQYEDLLNQIINIIPEPDNE